MENWRRKNPPPYKPLIPRIPTSVRVDFPSLFHASEKLLKGYMSYILDFFKTYELDVENIQNGYYRQQYYLDPRKKQFNYAFILEIGDSICN